MNQLLNQTLRLAQQIAGWLWKKCWTEPAQIRGPVWTTALWIFIAMAVTLFQDIPKNHYVPALLLIVAWLVMSWQNRRPKKLGRPLPYRRRR